MLLGWDQSRLAAEASLSLPTIQRMEASDGNVRGNVDSLVKVVEALEFVVRQGKVLYLGASSMWTWQFVMMREMQKARGYSTFVAMQIRYHRHLCGPSLNTISPGLGPGSFSVMYSWVRGSGRFNLLSA